MRALWGTGRGGRDEVEMELWCKSGGELASLAD